MQPKCLFEQPLMQHSIHLEERRRLTAQFGQYHQVIGGAALQLALQLITYFWLISAVYRSFIAYCSDQNPSSELPCLFLFIENQGDVYWCHCYVLVWWEFMTDWTFYTLYSVIFMICLTIQVKGSFRKGASSVVLLLLKMRTNLVSEFEEPSLNVQVHFQCKAISKNLYIVVLT